MELGELERLIEGGENHSTEFKQGPNDLAKEMVALANADGGSLVVGVDDHGGIRGLADLNDKKSEIQDAASSCDYPVEIAIDTVTRGVPHEGVIIVEIPDSDIYHKASDGFYIREGPNSRKMNREEIEDLVHHRGSVVYDEQLCEDFVYPDDFDEVLFERFLEDSDVDDLNLENREETLIDLDAARRDDKGEIVFTIAGVLMFAERPTRFFQNAEIICARYESEERRNFDDRRSIELPILQAIREIEAFVTNHLDSRTVVEGLKRKQEPEIPREVLREAIVNALMHRDYLNSGEIVHVDVFGDRVEIRNPGGLVEGMREEDLGQKSRRRNPTVAKILDKAGYVDRMGTGINRMKHLLSKRGMPQPSFDSNSHFKVVLPRSSRETLTDFSEADLDRGQKKALRKAYEQGYIQTAGYSELNDVTKATARRRLKEMVDKGFMRVEGKTRGTKYVPIA